MGKLKERSPLRCKFTKFKSSDSSTQIFVALKLGAHLVDRRLILALWTDRDETFYKQFVEDKEDVAKIYKVYHVLFSRFHFLISGH